MGEAQKSRAQLIADAAGLRSRVAELEATLRQAGEVRAEARDGFTELEHLDAQEHEARRFAESIVRTVREPLLVLDEALRVRTANRSFYETFQATVEDTEGHLLHELGNGQWNIPSLRTRLESIVPESAQFQDFEVEHDFPTIGYRAMVLNARQIRWNGSKYPFILLAIEDNTERKRADLGLRRMLEANEQIALEHLREREFADAIVLSMTEGVIVFDGRGEVIRINAAARDMLGLDDAAQRMSSVEIDRLLSTSTPGSAPGRLEAMPAASALRGESVVGRESVLRRLDGRIRWVSTSAAPITPPNGESWGAVLTIADVTSQHVLQEERDEVMRAVSHDLRNPLTVVLGQAQVMIRLLKNAKVTGRMVESAKNILIGGRRMDSMIQDLTDSLRLESGQLVLRLESVHLKSHISGLLSQTAESMEVERVRLEIPEDLPLVNADSSRLERILINLVSNALKYSPPSSEVLLKAESQDGEVRISVIDHGRGIAAEDLPHIFERFHRVRGERREGGLGLGLSITKGLVEAHGGELRVESKANEGSTFTFTLPLEG